MKTVTGDVFARLKPQKSDASSDCNVLLHHYMLSRMLLAL